MPSKCVNSHAQGLAVDTRVYSSVSFWKRTVNSTIITRCSSRERLYGSPSLARRVPTVYLLCGALLARGALAGVFIRLPLARTRPRADKFT